ncbi:predicted protein [Pyrenophora tritici-repentis Pt-1C-BFP]|uniref:Uncharacterized protein n=1 Tax=Pyrenophora tritici-repentis (strain Pt-1C-BFP) TaxID=426418 RepID=B2WPH5_PYRTR|nr:uncharacterized protein PTRG_11885 [Pyrenophora tritici-repentis Pt-1C-BFP]EDU46041.1 predicted protein [Pyrenophora tritici-repentis Pt-1C-BFP]
MATKSDPALFIRRDVANRHGLWQYINPNAGATRLSDLTADDRESYRWECDRWERRRSDKTIAVRHINLIKDHETPYDRLVALKKFLCPTDATRRRELADKYNALKTAPRATKKVEQWLANWTYITA